MTPGDRPAFPLVISGPSGAGKTSVVEWLLENDPGLVLSVSGTTREQRGKEVDGIDYFYLSPEEFTRRRDRGDFCEWALVHGNFYGTPRSFLDRKIAEGKTVVLDIDVQGAMQIRQSRKDGVLVFLMPPSLEALEERLRGRHTDSEETIQRRLAAARREMETAPKYDYLVVNHRLEDTRLAVKAIVEAERARADRVLRSRMMETEPILRQTLTAAEAAENLERK
jgi:guanylate kinase